jgi:cytochrome c553
MKTSKVLAGAVIACALSTGAVAQDYTQAEIYTVMCQKCHGQFAEGNPKKKGPSLSNRTKEELAVDIYELESGGYQSSGSAHDVMEYNLAVIENKGMKVNADKMAKYIFESFTDK